MEMPSSAKRAKGMTAGPREECPERNGSCSSDFPQQQRENEGPPSLSRLLPDAMRSPGPLQDLATKLRKRNVNYHNEPANDNQPFCCRRPLAKRRRHVEVEDTSRRASAKWRPVSLYGQSVAWTPASSCTISHDKTTRRKSNKSHICLVPSLKRSRKVLVAAAAAAATTENTKSERGEFIKLSPSALAARPSPWPWLKSGRSLLFTTHLFVVLVLVLMQIIAIWPSCLIIYQAGGDRATSSQAGGLVSALEFSASQVGSESDGKSSTLQAEGKVHVRVGKYQGERTSGPLGRAVMIIKEGRPLPAKSSRSRGDNMRA